MPKHFSSAEREADGFIATLRDLVTGEVRVLHRPGPPRAELRTLVAEVDEWEGDWRFDSISSPPTILVDLQGSRYRDSGRGRGTVGFPELSTLGQIGRPELFARYDPGEVYLSPSGRRRKR